LEQERVAKLPIELIYQGYVCKELDHAFSESVKQIGALLPKELYWKHPAHWPVAQTINERTLEYSGYSNFNWRVKWSHARHNAATIIRGITRKNGKLTWRGATFSDVAECHAEAVETYNDNSHPDAVVYETVAEIINPDEPKRYDPDHDSAMVSWVHEAWSVTRLSFIPDESILKHQIEWN